jgi:two-component system, NarL family, response regulator LiaR
MGAEGSRRPIRIAVLNDFPVVVAGVAGMLAPYRDRVEVVETSTEDDVYQDVDLVLFDTFGVADHTPTGVRAILRDRSMRVVVFSWTTDPELVRQALDAGAVGFLDKSISPDQLVTRLEEIRDGAVITPARAAGRVARRGNNWPGAEHGLTPRESEIVALIARGLSNRDIAERSYLSINSVKTYIRTAYRKMGVRTRPQAVLWLVRNGFDPDARAHEPV